MPDCNAAFPEAEAWLAPGVARHARERIAFRTFALGGRGWHPWDGAVATLLIEGRFLTEIVFYHRPSRTLIVTDFLMNFEPHEVCSPLRWLARVGGASELDGGTPLDIRAGFLGRRERLRTAARAMVAWGPERIVLAHGCWYERDGADELQRAFRWLRP